MMSDFSLIKMVNFIRSVEQSVRQSTLNLCILSAEKNHGLSISRINKLMALINSKDLGEIFITETSADTNGVFDVLMGGRVTPRSV